MKQYFNTRSLGLHWVLTSSELQHSLRIDVCTLEGLKNGQGDSRSKIKEKAAPNSPNVAGDSKSVFEQGDVSYSRVFKGYFPLPNEGLTF